MSRDPLPVVVVPTGVANLASVRAGLERAGGAPRLAESASDVARAAAVVVPGVGTFRSGATALARLGLAPVLRERIAAGRATLCVCLGMQLLLEGSEESPGTAGLGIAAGIARRFPDAVRTPQFGWNAVEAEPGCRLLRSGFAYFANSYRLVAPPRGFAGAFAEHGGRFVAGFEKGAVLACQFHPELSGPLGRAVLEDWLAIAAHEEVTRC